MGVIERVGDGRKEFRRRCPVHRLAKFFFERAALGCSASPNTVSLHVRRSL